MNPAEDLKIVEEEEVIKPSKRAKGSVIESGEEESDDDEYWRSVKHVPPKRLTLHRPKTRRFGRDYDQGIDWHNPKFWGNASCYRVGDIVRLRRQRFDNGKHWIYIRRKRVENGTTRYQWMMLPADALEGIIQGLMNIQEEIDTYGTSCQMDD